MREGGVETRNMIRGPSPAHCGLSAFFFSPVCIFRLVSSLNPPPRRPIFNGFVCRFPQIRVIGRGVFLPGLAALAAAAVGAGLLDRWARDVADAVGRQRRLRGSRCKAKAGEMVCRNKKDRHAETTRCKEETGSMYLDEGEGWNAAGLASFAAPDGVERAGAGAVRAVFEDGDGTTGDWARSSFPLSTADLGRVAELRSAMDYAMRQAAGGGSDGGSLALAADGESLIR